MPDYDLDEFFSAERKPRTQPVDHLRPQPFECGMIFVKDGNVPDKNVGKFATDTNVARKRTHYDEIKSVSVEELAEWAANLPCCPPGPDLYEACFPENRCSTIELKKKCWLDWLKQEVGDA